MHPRLTYKGHQELATHKCCQFSQAAHTPVLPTSGTWNLWENANPHIRRAQEIYPPNIKKELKEELDVEMAPVSPAPSVPIDIGVDDQQFQERRPKTTSEKLDESLDDLVEDKEFDSDEEARRLNQTLDECIKEGPKVPRVKDIRENPGATQSYHPFSRPAGRTAWHEHVDAMMMAAKSKGSPARGSNEPPPGGMKRQFTTELLDPMSPESIRKKGRQQRIETPSLMTWHYTSAFPKYLMYHRGELHLVVKDIMHGLRFKPEHYSPVLQVKQNGDYKYVDVGEYNSKWLKFHKGNSPQQ